MVVRFDPAIKNNTKSVFVDRNGPRRIFENAALDLLSAPYGDVAIRTFYGVGGQGKTALCLKLIETVKHDKTYASLKLGHVDLRGRTLETSYDILLLIRNSLSRTGVSFPVFDLAFSQYWETELSHRVLPRIDNPSFARTGEAATVIAADASMDVAQMAADVVSLIPGLGKLSVMSSRWVVSKSKLNLLKARRSELKFLQPKEEKLTVARMMDLLPYYLGKDLEAHILSNPKHRFVLFIDEYERLLHQGGAGQRFTDNIVVRMVQDVARNSFGLLLVMFSRHKIHWNNDNDWDEYFSETTQTVLGGLSLNDAREWLLVRNIVDEDIQNKVINNSLGDTTSDSDAPVFPLLLQLQLEHMEKRIRKGLATTPDDLELSSSNFRGRRLELIERVLRDYSPELECTLECLALTPNFDEATFRFVVDAFGTGFPPSRFSQVINLSLVKQSSIESDDGSLMNRYSIHQAVSDALIVNMAKEQRSQRRLKLAEYFRKRSIA